MLMNTKKPKRHSSISPPSTVSVGLSNRLEPESQPAEHLQKEMISRIVAAGNRGGSTTPGSNCGENSNAKRGTNEK